MTSFLRLFAAAVIPMMAAPWIAAQPGPAVSSDRLSGGEAAPAVAAADLAGDWEGSLDAGPQGSLRLVVHLTLEDDGTLGATIDSVDQNAYAIPVAGVELEGRLLRLDVAILGAGYEGEISPDLQSVDGDWSQGGNTLSLLLTRNE